MPRRRTLRPWWRPGPPSCRTPAGGPWPISMGWRSGGCPRTRRRWPPWTGSTSRFPGPGLAGEEVLRMLDEGRLARHGRKSRPEVLRIRHRRRATGGAGGRLAGRLVGSERGDGGDVTRRSQARRAGHSLDGGRPRPARRRRWLVTGATMANLTGLLAARESLLRRQGWDVSARGLFDAPPITVVVGAEVHVSLRKSLAVLGLGKDRVVRVAVDDQGRMRPDAFPALDGPAIVCLQAGNVNSGAFDPAAELIPAPRPPARGSTSTARSGSGRRRRPRPAHLMAGFDRADSWATDAHKWLNAGYDCGIALLRDTAPCGDALDHGRLSLPRRAPPADALHARVIPPGTRSAGVGGAEVARPRSGLAGLVERRCRDAARFAEGLRAAGFEVLNDVVLNQVVVVFGDAEETRRVIAARATGRHLLVRRDEMEGPWGDAGQRQRLEHDPERHRRERSRGPRLRPAIAPGRLRRDGARPPRPSGRGRWAHFDGPARRPRRGAAGRQVGRARAGGASASPGLEIAHAAATGSRSRCTSRGRRAARSARRSGRPAAAARRATAAPSRRGSASGRPAAWPARRRPRRGSARRCGPPG